MGSVAMRHPIKTVDPASVKLLSGWVMFKRDQRAEKVGSIYMPETQRRPVSTGIIVGMGPMPVEKEKRAPHYELVSQAKAGDRIHIHGHAAVEARLEWGGDAYDIVQSEDVCAVEPAA